MMMMVVSAVERDNVICLKLVMLFKLVKMAHRTAWSLLVGVGSSQDHGDDGCNDDNIGSAVIEDEKDSVSHIRLVMLSSLQ